jgi:ketosteroid isomerase-like protein
VLTQAKQSSSVITNSPRNTFGRRQAQSHAVPTTLELAKTFFEAKSRHDIDTTMATFAATANYIFPLPASGEQKDWFRYEGKAAITEYQTKTLKAFSQIRMFDQQFYESTDGETVFVESRGDYIAEEGKRHYNNVYVFKFVGRKGLLEEVLEYANPVTYAQLVGLPLGKNV